MIIIDKKIPLAEIKKIAKERFGNLVKAVVDVEKEIIAVGGELHSDEEALLLENSSKQASLWGINIYPDVEGNEWIEFDSIINLRPSQNNLSRGIEDPEIRKKILNIINTLIQR